MAAEIYISAGCLLDEIRDKKTIPLPIQIVTHSLWTDSLHGRNISGMGKEKCRQRNPILLAFGLAVQRRRRELGISQEEAAARTGIHRTYFADVERGTRNIGLLNITAIAKGLESTPSKLMENIR